MLPVHSSTECWHTSQSGCTSLHTLHTEIRLAQRFDQHGASIRTFNSIPPASQSSTGYWPEEGGGVQEMSTQKEQLWAVEWQPEERDQLSKRWQPQYTLQSKARQCPSIASRNSAGSRQEGAFWISNNSAAGPKPGPWQCTTNYHEPQCTIIQGAI